VSVGTGEEEEEEEEEGDEEEASLTRGRKGKEKAATAATSKSAAARKKTIVVGNEDNEGDDAAGEAMKPACAFPEWTQRDLDEELFFYPDDIAYTVLCTHPAPSRSRTLSALLGLIPLFSSSSFFCCWGSFRIRTAS
jgi:cobalamin biosynthesis protein CobT